MKGSTSLSIITCTWNSEKYLRECIESVKNQLWNLSIEHIFVDGLSTDKTLEIIQSYQEECKDRIDVKILQSSPKGVYNAMNQGIENATGDYLLFLNSDDYLEDDILGKYLEQVKLSKKDIYYGNIDFFTPEGQHFPTGRFHWLRLFLAKLGFHTLFYHPSCLIKRQLFNELGKYDEKKKIASDYGFWLRATKHRKSLEYFPHIVAHFRIHEDSLSTSWANADLSIQEIKSFRIQEYGFYGKIIHAIGMLCKKLTGKYI